MKHNLLDRVLLYLARKEFQGKRAEFYFDVAAAMADKVPLFSILKSYEARARRRSRGDALMYREMLNALQVGGLADALHGMVSPTELILLDAIQMGGDAQLSEGLYYLSETVGKLDRMSAVARKAMIYPLMLLAMFTVLLVGFSLYVVPIIAQLMPVEKWPPIGQALYAVSQFIINYGIYVGASFIFLIVAFLISLSLWQSRVRRFLDRFVPYSVYRAYTGAMLIVALSVLLKSGISLRSALERSMKFSSRWMRWHLHEILKGLSGKSASSVGLAFRTGLLHWELEDRIEDASKRRDPIQGFVNIGVGSMDKLIKSVEKTSGQINTAMMLIGGLILGFMALGFALTVMEIQSSLTSK